MVQGASLSSLKHMRLKELCLGPGTVLTMTAPSSETGGHTAAEAGGLSPAAHLPLGCWSERTSSRCHGTGRPAMKVRKMQADPAYSTAPRWGMNSRLPPPLRPLPVHARHPRQWRVYLGGSSLLSWLLRSSLLMTWVMSTVLAASRALASSSSCLRTTGLGLERR